jgi:hypothetical protein
LFDTIFLVSNNRHGVRGLLHLLSLPPHKRGKPTPLSPLLHRVLLGLLLAVGLVLLLLVVVRLPPQVEVAVRQVVPTTIITTERNKMGAVVVTIPMKNRITIIIVNILTTTETTKAGEAVEKRRKEAVAAVARSGLVSLPGTKLSRSIHWGRGIPQQNALYSAGPWLPFCQVA